MNDKNENGEYYIKVWLPLEPDAKTPLFSKDDQTMLQALSVLRELQPDNRYEICKVPDQQSQTSNTPSDAEEDASQVIYPDVWDMSPLDT
jgi:hypothetical protein